MAMKIIKRKKKGDMEYALVSGVEGDTLLSDIAKRYSKNYMLTAFSSGSMADGNLLLIKRKKPISKPYQTWIDWEYEMHNYSAKRYREMRG